MLIMFRARALALATLLMLLCCSARQGANVSARPIDKDAPSIDVTLEEIAGGKKVETKTDENGRFSFSNVEAGVYKLRIGCVYVRASERAGATGQRDAERCRAEMRIVVTDGSKGEVSGFVGKGN